MKTMENTFKNNEHKFQQMPSERAWQKLEGRLEAHRARSRRLVLRRSLAAAASVALLVVVAALFYFRPSGLGQEQRLFAQHPDKGVLFDGLYAPTQNEETLALAALRLTESDVYKSVAFNEGSGRLKPKK
jgi:hypothetical protein